MDNILSNLLIQAQSMDSAFETIILADNGVISNNTAIVCFAKSKTDSENIPNFISNQTVMLNDLFEDNMILTPTANSLPESIRMSTNLSNISTIKLLQTDFNYNKLLLTNTGAVIALHPSTINPNKKGKRVDLNILGWYLILKSRGFKVIIASEDKHLLASSKTFTYLDHYV